jgi:hypothetical protein
MGLVRPIIDVDLSARMFFYLKKNINCLIYLLNLVPQYRQIQQIAQRLRMIGDELDADQRIRRLIL